MSEDWYTDKFTHMGRGFEGHVLEDNCPCPKKAACGLIVTPGENPECDQHGSRFTKTMRQMHRGNICPAKPIFGRTDGRPAWPTPKLFITRDHARALLEVIFDRNRIYYEEIPYSAVVAVRELATQLDMNPDHYLPVMNRYQFKHKWVEIPEEPNKCAWCEKSFAGGRHK